MQNENFVDQYDNPLVFNQNTTYDQAESGDVLTMFFSTNANNSKPHTPQLSARGTSNVDYNSGFITLNWNVDESPADVKEYELWEKKDTESSYERMLVVDRDDAAFNEITGSYSVSSYGDPLVIVRGIDDNTPDEAVTRKIQDPGYQ